MSELQEVLEELNAYKTFEEGWDGYHAVRFNSKFIDEMKIKVHEINDFVASEGKEVNIIPGPCGDGCIDLEILYEDKTLLLTMDPTSDIVYVFKEELNSHKATEEYSKSKKDFSLKGELNWLIC